MPRKKRMRRPDLDRPLKGRPDLIRDAHKGDITLVVGAGISIPRGIPNWECLARVLWNEVFVKQNSPRKVPEGIWSPREVTQSLPIVFELVYRELGEERFLKLLQKYLYQNVRYPSDDPNFIDSSESLAVLARVIVQEHKRKSRGRISAIITLNADDLIEQAVFCVAGKREPKEQLHLLRAIARPTHTHLGGLSYHPILVYHIHGFLPSSRLTAFGRHFEHMLVFTDTQYWSTSASGLAFANRIMASALSEGRCIFIGLSMTDINLLRWLALRTLERDRDFIEASQRYAARDPGIHYLTTVFRLGYHRHYWIRPKSDDPTGFLSEFLRLRGVHAVEIDDWKGNGFQKLMAKCFPPDHSR